MTEDQRAAWANALADRAAARRRTRYRRTSPPIRAGMIRVRAAPPTPPAATGPKE